MACGSAWTSRRRSRVGWRTGAWAAVVTGIRLGLLDTRVDVEARGGTLTIEWTGGAAPVLMTGPATTVFEGEIEL